MTTVTWAGPAASLAIVVGLATGCGAESARDGSDSAAVGTTVRAAHVQAMADELKTQLYGNAEQREAEHYLLFRAMNQPYEECMQDRGIDFVAEYHPIHVGSVPDGTAGRWMGALNRKPSDVYAANAEAAYDDTTGGLPEKHQTPEFEAAKDACDGTNASGPDYEYFEVPAQAAYSSMLERVEKQLGSIDSYTECMKNAGVDYTVGSDGEEGWVGLYLYLTTGMPRPPLPGAAPSEEWTSYLKVEARALAADEECRADRYEEGLHLLEPLLEGFRERNSADLQKSRWHWQAFVTEAEAIGWTYPG